MYKVVALLPRKEAVRKGSNIKKRRQDILIKERKDKSSANKERKGKTWERNKTSQREEIATHDTNIRRRLLRSKQ